MIKRTVKSPAGEEIEIVPDAEWLALTDQPRSALRQTSARLPVLGALWLHGKVVEPKNGRATARLHELATPLGYKAKPVSMTMVLSQPIMRPAYRDDTRGKRRYEIALEALPESWYRKIDERWPHLNGTKPAPPAADDALEQVEADRAAAEAVAALVMPPALPIEEPLPAMPAPDEAPADYAPPVELEIASSVAMALLTQVVEIISAGSPADTDRRVKALKADFDNVAEKLAKRLEENERMRRSIRELGDEVVAVRAERDGLRTRLRLAEANLERATNADAQRFINEQVQKELAKVMRAAPGTQKGTDDATL